MEHHDVICRADILASNPSGRACDRRRESSFPLFGNYITLTRKYHSKKRRQTLSWTPGGVVQGCTT